MHGCVIHGLSEGWVRTVSLGSDLSSMRTIVQVNSHTNIMHVVERELDWNCKTLDRTNHKIVFVDGIFERKIVQNFIPNQEQLRKMQLWALWQESNLRSCDSGAAL